MINWFNKIQVILYSKGTYHSVCAEPVELRRNGSFHLQIRSAVIDTIEYNEMDLCAKTGQEFNEMGEAANIVGD